MDLPPLAPFPTYSITPPPKPSTLEKAAMLTSAIGALLAIVLAAFVGEILYSSSHPSYIKADFATEGLVTGTAVCKEHGEIGRAHV